MSRQRGHDAGPGRAIWFFLARRHFAAKTPPYDRWICLDFLGFSRPNRDLSMGCAGFSAEVFSCALSWREKPERAPAVEAFRKGGIVHGASLLQFPIVSNQLSWAPERTPSSLLILTLAISIGCSRSAERYLGDTPLAPGFS